jgi:hypothetical protein
VVALAGYRQGMAGKLREIDWQGADVKDGTVELPLTGQASDAWSEGFKGVLALLEQRDGGWGQISLTKKAIKVAQLRPGSEDDLRHFLQSIVVQVNTQLAPEPDAQANERDDPQAARDDQMAEKLRSFAAQEP